MSNSSTGLSPAKGNVVGMDIGDNWTQLVVMDREGVIVQRQRVRTRTPQLDAFFADLPPARVVLEVGTHSPWISRLLANRGFEAVVLNPYRLKLIAQSTNKSDLIDAVILADIGRVGMSGLRPVTHREAQEQADLELLRARSALVRQRTGLINHVRGAVKSFGGRIPASSAHSFASKAAGHLPDELTPALLPLLAEITSLTHRIKEFDTLVVRLISERYPDALALQQPRGVGPITSLTFVLTLSDPTRFASSRQVGAYLGLTSRNRRSGGRAPELRITRAGDHELRRLLVQAAHYILTHPCADSDLRRWGLEKAGSSKNARKRAAVAVARKLAVLLHRLWLTGDDYQPFRSLPVPIDVAA